MAAETMNEEEARSALHAVNAKVAEQARWPWSRHAAYAGVVAGMVASQGFDVPVSTALIGACTCAIAAIVATDRARRGVWISGWQGARWVTVLSLVVGIGALFLSLWLNRNLHAPWASFALAGSVFVVLLLLSKLWESVYRRGLGRGA